MRSSVRTSVGLSVALATAAAAVPATAATPLGGLPPGPAALPCADVTRVQDSAGPASPYVVPADGVITAWSTHAGLAAGSRMRLKVMRRTGAPADFDVVGESALESLSPGTANTFATRIPVRAGDVLGQRTEGGAACAFATASPSDVLRSQTTGLLPTDPAPADPGAGQGATLETVTPAQRLNLAAVFEPDADGDGFGDDSQDGCVTDCGGEAPDAPPPAPSPVQADPAIAVVGVPGSVRVDRKGRFRIPATTVLCPTPGASCTVSFGVATAKKVRSKSGKKRRVGFAERSFAVKAGGATALKVKLSKKGLAALRRLGRAQVVALVGAGRPGAVPSGRVVAFTLKAPKPKKRR